MKNQDFINSNIGNKVYVNGNWDLAFNGELRPIINNLELDLVIVKLTKKGDAYLYSEQNKLFYTVPIQNIRLIGT